MSALDFPEARGPAECILSPPSGGPEGGLRQAAMPPRRGLGVFCTLFARPPDASADTIQMHSGFAPATWVPEEPEFANSVIAGEWQGNQRQFLVKQFRSLQPGPTCPKIAAA